MSIDCSIIVQFEQCIMPVVLTQNKTETVREAVDLSLRQISLLNHFYFLKKCPHTDPKTKPSLETFHALPLQKWPSKVDGGSKTTFESLTSINVGPMCFKKCATHKKRRDVGPRSAPQGASALSAAAPDCDTGLSGAAVPKKRGCAQRNLVQAAAAGARPHWPSLPLEVWPSSSANIYPLPENITSASSVPSDICRGQPFEYIWFNPNTAWCLGLLIKKPLRCAALILNTNHVPKFVKGIFIQALRTLTVPAGMTYGV